MNLRRLFQNRRKTSKRSNAFEIRPAATSDLHILAALDRATFEGDSLPTFYFVQAKEIFSKTFYVAENGAKEIIGYGIAAPEQEHPDTAWILSMGVVPGWRKQGVGNALMCSLLDATRELGIKRVLLTTSEKNNAARKLYEKLGFSVIDYLPNYFGKGVSRLLLEKNFTSTNLPQVTDPSLLMSETEVGVSFMNILFAVSSIVFATLADKYNSRALFVPFYYLFLIIFASLYSSLFYANVTGNISRLGRVEEVFKPMRYGNTISEFLGFYPLVISFPMIVWLISSDKLLTTIAFAIDAVGFYFYQVTGFDILGRLIPNRLLHRVLTLTVIVLTAIQISAIINGSLLAIIGTAFATSILLFSLTLLGLVAKEKTVKG